MAEKEYLLGNRARELLRYTNQATRIVSDEVSAKDVRAIIRRIAETWRYPGCQDRLFSTQSTCWM